MGEGRTRRDGWRPRLIARRLAPCEGEILRGKRSDLEWQSGHLGIQRQLQRCDGKGLVWIEPKGAKSRKVMTLSSNTMVKLEEHLANYEQERALAGAPSNKPGLIFPYPTGGPWDPRDLYRINRSLDVSAQVSAIRFHDLRHPAATPVLPQRIHLRRVQERLGHSNANVTLTICSHSTLDMQSQAASVMDEIVTPIAISIPQLQPIATNRNRN